MTSEQTLIASVIVLAFLVFGHCVRELYLELTSAEPATLIERCGYIEGFPSLVECSVCGSGCHHVGTFKRGIETWTEWACTRCVKG